MFLPMVMSSVAIGGILGGVYGATLSYAKTGSVFTADTAIGIGIGALAGAGFFYGGVAIPLLGSLYKVTSLALVWYAYYGVVDYVFLGGAPSIPDSEQEKVLDQCKILIRSTSGFSESNIPTYILVAKPNRSFKDWWGLSPSTDIRTIYLNENIFKIPMEFIASTIVHESVHQTQAPYLKGYYGEPYAYQAQSDFLKAVGASGTAAQITARYPNAVTQEFRDYLGDLCISMEEHGVKHPQAVLR